MFEQHDQLKQSSASLRSIQVAHCAESTNVMLNIFNEEQVNEAVAMSKKANVKHIASVAKKTLFHSNLTRTNKETAIVKTADSAKSDFIIHIMLLNSVSVHVNNCKELCSLIDLQFKTFVDHCHNAAYKKSTRLSEFIDVDVLKAENKLVAVNQESMRDLFLLQATQKQYETYVSALFDFMQENTLALAHDVAFQIEANSAHDQALIMNSEYVAKAVKKTAKKRANSKK